MSRKTHNFTGLSALAIVITAILLCCGYLYEHPMAFTTTTHQAELGENYSPYHYLSFLFMAGNGDVEIIGDIDTETKGTYQVTVKARQQEVPVTVTVTDTQPPKLTLKELKVDTKKELTPEDFIEDVSDAQKTTVEFKAGSDITQKGKSKVTIIATDADGNKTEAQTTLQRVDDLTAPVIKGVESSYELIMGTKLDTSKINATDDLDPEPVLKVDTSNIDIAEEGEYELKVSATDASGNKTEITRPVKVIENPEYAKNIVYLTFDDGPSDNTPKILDILKKDNIKATFFVTAQQPEYAKWMTEADKQGHTVALHTYSHNYDTVYKNDKAYWDDLIKIQQYVKKYTGKESKIVRFPGGSSNTISANYSQGIMTRLTEQLRKKGYQYYDWNVTSSDASGWGVPVNDIVKSACTDMGGNLVVLMHDTAGKETTVQALPKIIKYYQDRGYEFRALDEESFPAHHGVNN